MRRCTIITLSIYGGGKGQIKAFKYYIRGAIIKKMEKFGKHSLMGGGLNFFLHKKVPISIWEL